MRTLSTNAPKNKARTEIVRAANVHCAYSRFTTRRLQQAVRVVRHHGLIDDRTLAIAGFGPRKAVA
jgi:hypothetical protein